MNCSVGQTRQHGFIGFVFFEDILTSSGLNILIFSLSDITVLDERFITARRMIMPDNKRAFILSFLIGGLIGGGATFLLSRCLTRTGNRKLTTRTVTRRQLSDEIEERPHEEGDYCAPEGADIRFDTGKDIYYSNEEE